MFFYSQTWHLLRSDCLSEWCVQYCFTNGHSSDTDRCKYCRYLLQGKLGVSLLLMEIFIGCLWLSAQAESVFFFLHSVSLSQNWADTHQIWLEVKDVMKTLEREAVRGNERCQPRTRWQQLHVLFLPVLQYHLYDCFLLFFRMAPFQNRTTEWFEIH